MEKNLTNTHSVIILAAGDGSRLKSSIPKVFHKIGGLCLLDHVIKTSSKINPIETVVVLKPIYENLTTEFLHNTKKAYQKTPLGSADAVKCAITQINNDNLSSNFIFILYADIPLVTEQTLQQLLKNAISNDTAISVLAMPTDGAKNLGKLAPAEKPGTIKAIVEAKDQKDSDELLDLCNAGLLIRKDILLNMIDFIKPSPVTGELYITELVRLAYEAGHKCGYFVAPSSELLGVNTRFELSELERNFQNRERLKHMTNGVTLSSPETVFFAHDTELEQDVTILPFVWFENNVKIKSGSTIGPFCTIEGSNITNASVGPFARIRQGSEICANSKIGNFVETKNSTLSQGCKVNHLSYIGDCCVGAKTNVGAGTITCNYDGETKHKTIIGENVFVGSNTAIVAPVEIESNSIIGAGSVITKHVKSNELAIARAHQINIKNWASKKGKK